MGQSPPSPAQEISIALGHHRAGRLADADAIYRRLLQAHPNHSDLHHLHGLVELSFGRIDGAIESIRKAISLNSANSDYHTNLGNALRRKQLNEEAVACYKESLRLSPNVPEAHSNLGNALVELGRIDEAIVAQQQAISLRPDFALAHANLGNALRLKGHLSESIAAQRKAIQLLPGLPELRTNLALTLSENGQLDESIDEFEESLRLKPNQPSGQSNFGSRLMKTGQIERAVVCFETAAKLAPNDAAIGSNLVFALNFDRRASAAEILARHRQWAARITPERPALFHAADYVRNPDRKLRIGYVSAYLWDHVIARNMLPLFRNRNKAEFETICYASVTKPDVITSEVRSFCDTWRDIATIPDEAAARIIAQDRIDILVDLTLHLPRGRLLIFGDKPAPIQITFAGYPGTTGMKQIDYRLTDPYLDPPGETDPFYCEKSIRLPHSFWCYDPDAMNSSAGFDVSPLPAQSNGFITFGCLNSFHKVNADCLKLWARTMATVPKSRMILLAPPGKTRDWVKQQFRSEGVEPDRVDFVGRQSHADYLHTYDGIDIGLDSFPYNGHTTSLDSAWMGAPVVTLVGSTVVGRAGLSQLSNLNLAELAARSDEEFIRIVKSLASDIRALAKLRAGLRQRMLQSPVTDCKAFAEAIEIIYRNVWKTWCARSE
jgi:predicted O-linked N-acetylglucosamine transferase (SPINDLY family)